MMAETKKSRVSAAAFLMDEPSALFIGKGIERALEKMYARMK